MTDQDSSSEQKDQATGSRREPSFKRHGSRYRARRRAVDFLFEAEQRGIDAVELLEERLEMVVDPELDIKPIAEYTEAIVRGVAAEIVGIDATIAEYLSDEWPLRRIPAVDRAILRLSTWELFHNSEIPPRVAVVEGVELASEYSTDVAPPYINAVLDAEAEVADQARLAAAAVSVSITAEPCESTSFAQIAQEQLADDAARDVLANGDAEEFKVVEEPAVSDDAAQVADKESNNTPASE